MFNAAFYQLNMDLPISLDADKPDQVASGIRPGSNPGQLVATFIEVTVDGPGDANRLFIFTGTALVNYENFTAILRDEKHFQVILAWRLADKKDFRGSSTYASLATIQSDDNEDFAHALLTASTTVQNDGTLRLVAQLGVWNDSAILRLSYQACVLAHVEVKS